MVTILNNQGIEPLWHNTMETSLDTAPREINRLISRADAYIFLIGPYYGTPMRKDGNSEYRQSYTQYEFFRTLSLKSPNQRVYRVYLTGPEFFPDLESEVNLKQWPYSDQFAEWQENFRCFVKKKIRQYHTVNTELDLALELANINWRTWPDV